MRYAVKIQQVCGTAEYLHPKVLAVACEKGVNYGVYSDSHLLHRSQRVPSARKLQVEVSEFDIHLMMVNIFEVVSKVQLFRSNIRSLREALYKLIQRKSKRNYWL